MAKMNFKEALNKSLQTTKKYVDDQIVKNKFSGDYNDLENRPVYEDNIITKYTFDGNSEGKLLTSNTLFVKISDDTPTFEECLASGVVVVHDDSTGEIIKTVKELKEEDCAFSWAVGDDGNCIHIEVLNSHIYIVNKAGLDENKTNYTEFPEKGIYFSIYEFGQYISEFSMITGTEIKQLDEKFIPFETEEETLNRLLEAEFVLGTMQLEDGTYLTDNDGNIIIF